MADYGTRRAERPDFHDGDPFAELTRIMGRDPRRDDQPEWHDASIDLESELLGGLDLSEDRHQPAADAIAPDQVGEIIPVAFARQAEPAPAWEPEAASEDLSLDLDASFADEIEAALRREVADFEPAADENPAAPFADRVAEEPPHFADQAESAAEDGWPEPEDEVRPSAAPVFDDAPAWNDAPEWNEGAEPAGEQLAAAPAYEEPAHEEPAAYEEPAYEESAFEGPADEELAPESASQHLVSEAADERATLEVADEERVDQPEQEEFAEDWVKADVFDAAMADDSVEAAGAVTVPEVDEWSSARMEASAEPAWTPTDAPGLQDEGEGATEGGFDLPELDLSALDWHDAEPAALAADDEVAAEEQHERTGSTAERMPSIEDELAAMLAADPSPAVARAAGGPAGSLSWQPIASAGAAHTLPRMERDTSYGTTPYRTAVTTPTYASSPSTMDQAEAQYPAEPYHDEIAKPEAVSLPRTIEDEYGVPEIETIEVAEHVPGPSQELHVPDLPAYDAPPPAEFDDLAAELDQAFELLDIERDHRAGEPNPVDAGYGHEASDYAATAAVDGFQRQEDAYPAAYGARQQPQATEDWSLGDDFDGRYAQGEAEEFEFDTEPMADVVPVERRSGSRRGLFVALGVAVVAIAGGAGIYALSSGSPTSGEPVLVRADVEPVRVRPENPGGTVVPNQDNEVYRRLSGIQQEQAASQERLVTTAEEPVDVAARTAPPVSAEPEPDFDALVGLDAMTEEGAVDTPATTGEVPASILGGERIASVKADERVAAPQDDAAASASDDVIALQPRRVRTMVVRPDGTMVPREEIEPEAGALAPEAEQQMASLPMALEPASDASAATGSPEAAAPEAAGAEATGTEAAAPAVVSPSNVPTPVDRPQVVRQPEAGQQPAAAAPQQQVASIAPAAPATGATAAAGEWSMQIASQPSAESAQATYQDLARRYGSLLEGRGVNIVRAEIEGRGTYFRVRIPTTTRDEAISLCTRYKAAGGSCFVSR